MICLRWQAKSASAAEARVRQRLCLYLIVTLPASLKVALIVTLLAASNPGWESPKPRGSIAGCLLRYRRMEASSYVEPRWDETARDVLCISVWQSLTQTENLQNTNTRTRTPQKTQNPKPKTSKTPKPKTSKTRKPRNPTPKTSNTQKNLSLYKPYV